MSTTDRRFPREEKLTRSSEFGQLYAEGRAVSSRLAVLYVMRKGQGRKVGFVVSKRLGKAVVRNRLKRLFREAYRLNKDKIADGVWMVFVVKRGSIGLPFWRIEREVLDLAERAGILNGR